MYCLLYYCMLYFLFIYIYMGNLRKASRRGKGTGRKGTRHKVRKIGRKSTRRKGTGYKSRKYRQRGGGTPLPPLLTPSDKEEIRRKAQEEEMLRQPDGRVDGPALSDNLRSNLANIFL